MKKLIILALLCAPMWGALAYKAGYTGTTGGTSCAVSSVSVATGDAIVAWSVNRDLSAQTLGIGDTVNTYTAAGTNFTDSGSTVIMRGWTAIAATSTTLTVTMTRTNDATSYFACGVMVFSGTSATPVDQYATGSFGAGTAMTTGTSGTTTLADEIVVGLMGGYYTAGTPSATAGTNYLPSGTVIATVGGTLAVGVYRIVTSTGTYQASATSSESLSGGGGMVVTLKAPASSARRRVVLIQ